MIKLRQATLADAQDLLKWKNDPLMRDFSIVSSKVIKETDHLKWLDKHIQDILIITYNGENCGDIRFDGNEVAIKLDEKFRGMGIAKKALLKALKGKENIIAKIVDGNVASMRLFQSCGFKVIDHQFNNKGYYILKR